MNTVVQVRHPSGEVHPRAELLSGTPSAVLATANGPVALFGPGEVVAYRIHYRHRTRVFVFRTLEVDDPLAASVPGVRPRVQLLLELGTRGRVRLVGGLCAYLARNAHDPSSLPDEFYVRVGCALTGRLPAHTILQSLIKATSSAAGTLFLGGASRADLATQASGANQEHQRDEDLTSSLDAGAVRIFGDLSDDG